MRMDEKSIIKFIWLPSETELTTVCSLYQLKRQEILQHSSLLLLKKFLSKLFNLSVLITELKPKITSGNSKEDNDMATTPVSMFFANYLFEVTAEIEFEYTISDSTDNNLEKYKKIITSFCSKRLGSSPELWLYIDFSGLLTQQLSTCDTFIDLESFFLGNIVKLNEFVEHFSSKTSLDAHGYKISQVKVKFLHDKEMLNVHFIVGKSKVPVAKRNPSTHKMFKLVIPYSSLHTILVCQNKNFSCYFRLYTSPMLFKVHQDEDDDTYISYMHLSTHTKWLRAVDLFTDCPSNIRKEFSMNFVLCLNFMKEDYEMLKIMLHHKSVQIYFTSMDVTPCTDVQLSLQIPDFNCYYSFHCLKTQSREVLDHLRKKNEMDLFKKFVTDKCKENPKALSDSFYSIHIAISRCNVIILNHSLEMLYSKFSLNKTDVDPFHTLTSDKESEKIIFVKRAVVIPTHVRFLPPQPILKSRALRSCDPDFSLRITVRDVNLETINFSFKGFTDDRKVHLREFFNKYFKQTLLNDIKVGGKRQYNYVGSSTSQLRGHGLWYYAKDDRGITARELRENFGNMDKIKQVPKYMARMGQTFSQACGRIKVSQKFTNIDCPEEDVKGGKKVYLSDEFDNNKFLKLEKSESDTVEEPYIFSDGIGRISKEIAEEVYVKLEVEDSRPSAMQIRYAGCKGMLVLDPKLEGKKIIFRESMKKFVSKDDSLEIIKFSEKRAASLNRPLITILEQLGVSKEVFIKLQRDMIQNHIKSMFSEPEACEFLNRNSKLRFKFADMYKVGICFTEDPLFRSMIYGLFQRQLDLLKKKANIEIPVNKGRAMFGVLDETFTLEYGEVFVQYSDWLTDEPKIIEGTVVVTKNPCMHGGDVRKFKAVNVEALHHIRDCIVFPAKGDRPHPDEMAGSDLDGDEYHVMWYEDLIFSRDNEPPMHFAVPKDHSKDLERNIEPTDELDHLCDYIVNDNVGLIAHAHLAFADKEQTGIFSENCVRLAKKYAIALDFAKSGRTASKHPKDRVKSYPDFMQKFGEQTTYLSKRALGVLYRNCKRLELGLETSNNEIAYEYDRDLEYENWELHKDSALKVYKRYCHKVEYLMNIYSFDSEGQLLSGAIINVPKYYEQRHDLENLMVLLEHQVTWLFNDLKKIFFSQLKQKPKDHQYTEEMYQKASAWYMVAYSKIPGKTYNYFGFPWAVADILIKLKSQKGQLAKNKRDNIKSLLESIVDQSLSRRIPAMTKETETRVIYENRKVVLDVALKVLNKWLKTQRNHILNPDLKEFQKLIDNEFSSVSETVLCCNLQYIDHLKCTNNLKKAISPAYYVIETLLQLACIKNPQKRFAFNDVKQELGLLSWVTLIKLACTYNPHYLGIADKDGNIPSSIVYLPQDNVVSTFTLHLFHKSNYNEEFSIELLRMPDKVKEYLKDISKLKDVDFRYGIDQNDHRYVAIFTVMGTRYAIEKLKDLVIQDEFFRWVVNKNFL